MKGRDRSFGKVSVVQMERAARSQWVCVEPRREWAWLMPGRILRMGRLDLFVSR